MEFSETSPLYRLLATKYDLAREQEALEILAEHPDTALLEWPGPDNDGQPFVRGSTPLHYAANDGKIQLAEKLVQLGADVNARRANWFRSVLAWAANNARLSMIQWLLERGANPQSLDAVHAAAWGGPSAGSDSNKDHVSALKLLLDAGADINDRRNAEKHTPLQSAIRSGNHRVADYLKSLGAE